MAVRSIWSIDIDDAGFKKFQQQFDRYRKLLSSSPAEWKKVQDAVGGTRKAFEALVAAETASIARTKLFAEAQKEAARRTQTLADHMTKVAGATKLIAGNLLDASRWALKLSAVGGLLGAGGLWGLDRLAIAASAGRRSSLGLGLSFGAQQSFGVNYSRLVNPEQFLGGVNAALHDLSQRPALYGAGLTEADIRGKDTGQVAAALIPALKRLADQTPSAQLGQVLQARHLDQFISLQDFERIKALSRSELADYQKHFMQDTVRFGLTNQQLIAWQRLQVQLTRAGDSIEATFIRGLTPLAKPLEKLSKGFADIVDAMLKSPAVKQWIEDFASGMETFAKFIGTPQFKQDVEGFVSGIAKLADKITTALEMLGKVPDKAERAAGGAIAGAAIGGAAGALVAGPAGALLGAKLGAIGGGAAGAYSGFGDAWLNNHPWLKSIIGAGGPGDVHRSAFSGGSVDSLLQSAATKYGVPLAIMRAVATQESGLGKRGRFLMGVSAGPGAWDTDPASQSEHGAEILARLYKRYGNWSDALAVYNSGKTDSEMGRNYVNHIGDILRQYGTKPSDLQPQPARSNLAMNYQQRFNAPSRGGVTNVYVHDRTGGSVVVSAAQLAT